MAIAPLLDPANADFDPADIVWVGSLSSAPAYCITTKASGIDTVEKFLSESFHVGATGKNTASYQQASIVKKALGAQFSIVTGFDGVPEILWRWNAASWPRSAWLQN